MPLFEIMKTAFNNVLKTKTIADEAVSTPVSLYARFDRMIASIIHGKDPNNGRGDGCVVSMYTDDL